MICRFALAAITDEFSPDLETAVRAMVSLGIYAAELRVVWGRKHHGPGRRATRTRETHLDVAGLKVIGIASPILKCTLPSSPSLDTGSSAMYSFLTAITSIG